MSEPKPETIESFTCTECSSGLMHLRFITYFTWLNEELLTVPNFPSWICDVCGRREYDEKAVSWLSMLLDPNAGKPTMHKRPFQRVRTRPSSRRPSQNQS